VNGSSCGGETAGGSDVSSVALVLRRRCLLLSTVILVGPVGQATQTRLFADLVLNVGHDAVETSELLCEGAVGFCHDDVLFVKVGDQITDNMTEGLKFGSPCVVGLFVLLRLEVVLNALVEGGGLVAVDDGTSCTGCGTRRSCEGQQAWRSGLVARKRGRLVQNAGREKLQGFSGTIDLCFDLFHQGDVTLGFTWKSRNGVGKVLYGWKEAWRVRILVVVVVELAEGASIVVDGPRGRGAWLTSRLTAGGVCVGGGYRGLSDRRCRRHGWRLRLRAVRRRWKDG
jgi:hypothetical protein